MKRIYLLISLVIVVFVLASLYFNTGHQLVYSGPKPDFSRIPPIKINEITVYTGGKKTIINDADNPEFKKLQEGLRTPIAYSGLFSKDSQGKYIMRIPSIYVPLTELIAGKAPGHEKSTVVVVNLAQPIDLSFLHASDVVPNQIDKMIFIPNDPDYNKIIAFSNESKIFVAVPTKRYRTELFSSLLKS